jgi:tRNA G10  N-methylase Trm11
MYSDIKTYFVEGPLMEYRSFKEVFDKKEFGLSINIRLAINCAVAFYHTYEHLYHNVKEINEEFRTPKEYLEKYILVIFSQFSFVRDIADCSKHSKLDRKNALISSASQIEEYLVLTAYEDEEGVYYVATKGLYATLNDGTEINIYTLLTNVRYFWLNELYKLGIVVEEPKEPDFSLPKPTRESVSGADNMNLIAMHGHPFNLKMKLYAETSELADRLSFKDSKGEAE